MILGYGEKSLGARRQSGSFVSSGESAEFNRGCGCYHASNHQPNANDEDDDNCRTGICSRIWGW